MRNMHRPYTIWGNAISARGHRCYTAIFTRGAGLSQRRACGLLIRNFAFFGPAEFDVGVLVAHLLLAGNSLEYALGIFTRYDGPVDFSASLALGFAGVEIMRRHCWALLSFHCGQTYGTRKCCSHFLSVQLLSPTLLRKHWMCIVFWCLTRDGL